MKASIKKVYLLIAISLLMSCDVIDEQTTDAKFTITNGTDTSINLNFLFEDNSTNNFSETLNPAQSYEGLTIESSVGGIFDDPNKSVIGAFFADSIEIIFNNERSTTYTYTGNGNENPTYSEPISRNLFRSGNYEEISEENFIYTITQEDYDNATPCDGLCE